VSHAQTVVRSAGLDAHIATSGHLPVVAIIIGAAIATAGGIWLVARLWPRSDADDNRSNEDGPGDGGPGGWGPRGPESDRPTPGGNEPEWWPQFEREFAAYSERRRHHVPVRSPTRVPVCVSDS
jgi:hypothetical protein